MYIWALGFEQTLNEVSPFHAKRESLNKEKKNP